MTCIAENRRPGKIIVDYVDASGRRRWRTFPKTTEGRKQARIFAGDAERKALRGEPGQDERITFKEACERWLLQCKTTLSHQTYVNYSTAMSQHVLPRLGDRSLARISRAAFKLYVTELVASNVLARSSIGTLIGTVRTFFQWCVEEALITTNPGERVLKVLKLERHKKDTVKALSRDQLSALLGASRRVLDEDGHLEILLMARCGLRMGECHGLQWSDFLDEERPRLRVSRQVTQHAFVQPPKTVKGVRLIDVSSDLLQALRDTWARRHEERLRLGVPMSHWLSHPEFAESDGVTFKAQVRAARKRVSANLDKALRAAGIPHHTPHHLRHSFATHLLMQGEPVVFVQQQLGHATISETVDVYGSWIQAESPGAVDRYAERTKAKESATVGEFKSTKNA